MASHEKGPAPAGVNDILNPHRAEEQLRARDHAVSVLTRRGVRLTGDETGDELADLWSAVDRFEAVVEISGGDTMTNSPGSAAPDNPAFVLPERRSRESAVHYTSRVVEAAEALLNGGRREGGKEGRRERGNERMGKRQKD